jgi:4-aminobutyrate--pyruvate transaminase
MATLSNTAKRDVENLIHPYTNLSAFRETGPLILESGKGVYVYDDKGKEYIEGMAGLWCTSLGFGEEELVEAATEQMRKLPYYHQFSGKSQEPGIELAERLKDLAPMPVSKVLFACSGSESNDTQIKLVWYYNNARGKPKKKKIISRMKAYHGVTIASASLTGLPANHRDFDLPLPGFLHTDCPHFYRDAADGETEEEFATRLAENLEELIQKEDPETIAAFIAEPIMGAGGVIFPPATYFEKIQALLTKYDILFIDDEVICGFGRTGKMFGAQTYNLKPDTMSIAKALSSAYLPISAVLLPDFIYDAMVSESEKIGVFGHGFTFGCHPVSAAVANKTLEIYETRGTVGHVQNVSKTLTARIEALRDYAIVGEAQSVGLIAGVQLVADKKTKSFFDPAAAVGVQCQKFAEQEGLIIRSLMGDRVAFCPPLIITDDEVNDMFDRFERAIKSASSWAKQEGLLEA